MKQTVKQVQYEHWCQFCNIIILLLHYMKFYSCCLKCRVILKWKRKIQEINSSFRRLGLNCFSVAWTSLKLFWVDEFVVNENTSMISKMFPKQGMRLFQITILWKLLKVQGLSCTSLGSGWWCTWQLTVARGKYSLFSPMGCGWRLFPVVRGNHRGYYTKNLPVKTNNHAYRYMHFFLEACACQGNTDQSLGLCVRGFSNQFYR